MGELLTTKQLQELLQIDRTTVYRMLKDGRLNGIKVGNQWRFSRKEVESLILDTPVPEPNASSSPTVSPDVLPLHCVQRIQDVFAEIAGLAVVTTAPTGEPLTELSRCCRFCQIILASESGRQACLSSWRKLAEQADHEPQFITCHAGLQYTGARIEVNGRLEAMLIAGQFYTECPSPQEELGRIQDLAEKHDLDTTALVQAAAALPVFTEQEREQIGQWLKSVAHTFEEIGYERAELMGRLRRIAEMSTFEPA